MHSSKLGDKAGLQIVKTVLIHTQIERLDVSNNGLGFKTGNALLQLLQGLPSYERRAISLQKLNLGLNIMSGKLVERVYFELREVRERQQSVISRSSFPQNQTPKVHPNSRKPTVSPLPLKSKVSIYTTSAAKSVPKLIHKKVEGFETQRQKEPVLLHY